MKIKTLYNKIKMNIYQSLKIYILILKNILKIIYKIILILKLNFINC